MREQYGIRLGPVRSAALAPTFAATRTIRRFLPYRVRFIAPYNEWRLRRRGKERSTSEVRQARRSVGIRLDG
jgi:hypothetical protein